MTALMTGPGAWVIGGQNKISYSVEPLLNAKKVYIFFFLVCGESKVNGLS
jgi:hypothetical protein